jgi:hypothetical protein
MLFKNTFGVIMKFHLLISLIISIASLYFCKGYLFFTSHHNGDYDDIDIFMQAIRVSTGSMARKMISQNFSITLSKTKFRPNFILNVLRDGIYED